MQSPSPTIVPNQKAPPPGDAAWTDCVSRLHAALAKIGYARAQWLPTHRRPLAAAFEPRTAWRFLTHSQAQLMETSAAPGIYRQLLRLRHPLAERSLAFFGLEESMPTTDLARLLADLGNTSTIEELLQLEILRITGNDQFECQLRFVPHGQMIFVADRYDRSIEDFAYLGRDSLRMATWLSHSLAGQRSERGLDICCGTGVQGLTLAAACQRVDGADLNPRSVAYANLNAQLNGLAGRAQFTVGNLAASFDGPYDVVVSNPPYVFMPPADAAKNRDGCGGGELGLELALRIIDDLDRLLADRGRAYLVLTSPVVAGRSTFEPLVANRLSGRRLGVRVTYLEYRFESLYSDFHREHGIDYVINCCVEVGRDLPQGAQTVRLGPASRLVNRAYVKLVNWRAAARKPRPAT